MTVFELVSLCGYSQQHVKIINIFVKKSVYSGTVEQTKECIYRNCEVKRFDIERDTLIIRINEEM